jgi:hypothetical protein
MINNKTTIQVKYNNVTYDTHIPINSIKDLETLKNSIKAVVDPNVKMEEMRLIMINGKLLDDERMQLWQADNAPITLLVLNEDKHLHITLSLPDQSKTIDVPFYQDENDMEEKYQADTSITTKQLKSFICEQSEGLLPPPDTDIYYGNKKLEGDRRLSDYNILPTSTLTVVDNRLEAYKGIAQKIINKTENFLTEKTSGPSRFKLFNSKDKTQGLLNTAWTFLNSIEAIPTSDKIKSKENLLGRFNGLVQILNDIEPGKGYGIMFDSFKDTGISFTENDLYNEKEESNTKCLIM